MEESEPHVVTFLTQRIKLFIPQLPIAAPADLLADGLFVGWKILGERIREAEMGGEIGYEDLWTNVRNYIKIMTDDLVFENKNQRPDSSSDGYHWKLGKWHPREEYGDTSWEARIYCSGSTNLPTFD